MNTPDPARLFRNVAHRRAQLEAQIVNGTWQPTAETMTVILRHTLGILQAMQVAIVADAPSISS
jgi:hypothetical protein